MMQHLQEQTVDSSAEAGQLQLSYPKQIEIWSGRLAMVGFATTVAVLALNVG
jgi:hypothetical protein